MIGRREPRRRLRSLLRAARRPCPWFRRTALLGWIFADVVAGFALAASAQDATAPPDSAPRPPYSSPRPIAFPLRFHAEIIRVGIIGDSLEVNGTYFLECRNRMDRPISLFYPFPEDSLLSGARMIEGRTRTEEGGWNPLRFQSVPGATGVRWWAPPCPGGMLEIESRYRQGLKEKYARYIVTSTRAWQEPLRHARFEIRLPEGAAPVEFSHPFEAAKDSSGVVYIWETDEFFPDRDITVRWR